MIGVGTSDRTDGRRETCRISSVKSQEALTHDAAEAEHLLSSLTACSADVTCWRKIEDAHRVGRRLLFRESLATLATAVTR